MAQQNSSPVPPVPPVPRELSDEDKISILQRRQGEKIVALCLAVALLSLYLFMDVRNQRWGLLTVKSVDYAWLQWLFAGLAGTALSQLWLAATGFEKIKIIIPPKTRSALHSAGQTYAPMTTDNFIQKTPTFLLNFLKGPVIVLVILFTLTNVALAASLVPKDDEQTTAEASATDETANSTDEAQETDPDENTNSSNSTQDTSDTELEDIPMGFAIDLRKAQPNVLVILAFVLGYYQKLAATVLDSIVKKIFGEEIWNKAYGDDPASGNAGGGALQPPAVVDPPARGGVPPQGDDPTKPKDGE